jgi:hypothetical protein
MSLRFLIDECLTPELVQIAVIAGHVESISSLICWDFEAVHLAFARVVK